MELCLVFEHLLFRDEVLALPGFALGGEFFDALLILLGLIVLAGF